MTSFLRKISLTFAPLVYNVHHERFELLHIRILLQLQFGLPGNLKQDCNTKTLKRKVDLGDSLDG